MAEKNDTTCFELESVADLFKKAEHDLVRLDNLVNSYDLFNYLCTINHVPDWHESGPIKDAAKSLQKNNSDLDLIRRLCNRSKHFKKISDSPSTSVKTGWGSGRWGKGSWGDLEPTYVVITDTGTELDVLELAKSGLEAWRKFLTENKLM